MAKKKAASVALELIDVRKSIRELQAVEKTLSTDLKRRIQEGEPQDYFKINKTYSYKIVDQARALKWAEQYPALITVNTTKAKSILDQQFGDCKEFGFEKAETERLLAIGQSNEEEN